MVNLVTIRGETFVVDVGVSPLSIRSLEAKTDRLTIDSSVPADRHGPLRSRKAQPR